MNKLFLPYKESLAMFYFGFDENCLGYYSSVADFPSGKHTLKPVDSDFVSFRPVSYPSIKAPLYQQAFAWFRNKHSLLYDISVDVDSGYSWFVYFSKLRGGHTSTYEEAELLVIKRMLEILEKIEPSIKIQIPPGSRRSAILDPMDYELSFIHDAVRNPDFDLGFKTGWVTKETKKDK